MPLPALLAWIGLAPAALAAGSSARWAYVDGYDNVNGGDWYRDSNDDYAPYLNGVESYVMLSLANLYEATGDPEYLERLAWHVDGVLAQRNDARGVTDFTGEQSPCWRDMYYTGGRPYCWVLHSGAIIEPMVAFAQLVARDGLGDELAYDGLSFAEKADAYVVAAEETVAYHDVEWHEDGYYIVRKDATFLGSEAGAPLPLNCSNYMGRALLRLYDVTGDTTYLDKATAIAEYYYNNLVLMSWGGYAWPYYGDDLLDLGEDISHGAATMRFAVLAWQHGVVFTDADMDRFVATLLDGIAIDDRAFHNNLNGGGGFDYDYDAQLYNWLPLSARDPAVYTTIANVYERSYPAADTTTGSLLEGWSLLALYAPPTCPATLGARDWKDPDEAASGDWNEARGASARLGVGPDGADCLLPLEVDTGDAVDVWVGGAQVARWQATDGPLVRNIPVNAAARSVRLLSEGAAVQAVEPAAPVAPVINAPATVPARVGEPVALSPTAEGDATMYWTMSRLATGARLDAASGALDWTPTEAGLFSLTLRVDNDAGHDTVEVVLCVDAACPADTGEPADTGGGEDTGAPADTGDTAPADTAPADTAETDSAAPSGDTAAAQDTCAPPARPEASGCATGGAGPGGLLGLGLAIALGLRRRASLATLGLLACTSKPEPGDTAACPPPGDTGAPVDSADTSPPADTAHTAETGGPVDSADTSPPADTAETGGPPDTGEAPRWTAVALTAGVAHTCALLDDGTVTCWGSATDDKTTPPAATFVAIDAGYYHTCGVTTDGTGACWGQDSYNRTSPPPFPLVAVAGAYVHSAGVTFEGGLAVWGPGGHTLDSEPSGSSFTAVSCGEYTCCARDAEGAATCWGQGAYGATSPPEARYLDLDMGAMHACGVSDAGEALCWGYDGAGETTPPEGQVWTAVAVGHVHSCGLNTAGEALCWGGDDAGQSSPPDATFSALTAGAYHTCGLLDDGGVRCWGNDAQGQSSPPAALAR